jgi:hypothetical protein
MRSVEAKHATTETETTMNARTTWMFGLAGLGLALVAPVHAAPNTYLDGAFFAARQEVERDARRDAREPRRDERRTRKGEAEAETENERGYGYGYERRKERREEEDSHTRGRR